MKYLLIIILIIFIGCNGDKQKKDLFKCKNNNTNSLVNHNNTIDENKKSNVIYSEKLSSILSEFTNEVDSIPNPFGESTCYSLSFYKEGHDTMIQLLAHIEFPMLTEQMKSYYEGKGSFYFNNKEVAIYDCKESLGAYFYNKDNLKPIPPYEEDSIAQKWAQENEGWTFVPPHILYKIKGDSLVEMKRYMGQENYDYYE